MHKIYNYQFFLFFYALFYPEFPFHLLLCLGHNNHNLRLARGNRSGSVSCNLRDFHSTLGDYGSRTIWDKMVYRLFLYPRF